MSDQNDTQLANNANFNSIMLKLGALEATANSTEQKIDALNDKVAIQNGRVANLEGWMKFMKGGMAVIGFAFTAAATYLGLK